MFPLTSHDVRENMTRIWQVVTPVACDLACALLLNISVFVIQRSKVQQTVYQREKCYFNPWIKEGFTMLKWQQLPAGNAILKKLSG